MAKKEFTYRGKTLEQLRALSISEFADLLPARQRRKIKRGFSDNEKKLVEDLKKKAIAKTHLRDMIIMPSMIGKSLKIHTGKDWQQVLLTEDMVGCYVGEMAITRKKVQHNAPGIGATKSSSSVAVK